MTIRQNERFRYFIYFVLFECLTSSKNEFKKSNTADGTKLCFYAPLRNRWMYLDGHATFPTKVIPPRRKVRVEIITCNLCTNIEYSPLPVSTGNLIEVAWEYRFLTVWHHSRNHMMHAVLTRNDTSTAYDTLPWSNQSMKISVSPRPPTRHFSLLMLLDGYVSSSR